MNELIVFFLSLSIIISLLHLIASIVIMSGKMKEGDSKKENNSKVRLPFVTIIKPLKGADDQLYKNLRSFFVLDYPNYEIIFGTEFYKDAAVPIVKTLQKEFPLVKSKLVVNNNRIGLNPKVNNMFNIYSYVDGEYLLINDSNTRVNKDFLKNIIGEFNSENIGLVTSTIHGVGAKNVASVWENIYLNTFVAPNVFMAEKLSNISIVIGKSILLSKKVLAEIGGFESLANYLAEDFMLGVKVKELNYEIKASLTKVENINEKMSFQSFLNRHTRWAKMRRNISIKNYLLEWFANPIFLSLLMMLYLQNKDGTLILTGVTLIKMIHDLYIMKLMNSDFTWHNVFAVPFKDLVIALIWFTPFFSYNVKWRGNKIKIGKDSILQSA